MSGAEHSRAEDAPEAADRSRASHLAPAGAQLVQGRAKTAYDAFVEHVQTCNAECRHAGIDCPTAAILRRVWREAKAEEKKRR